MDKVEELTILYISLGNYLADHYLIKEANELDKFYMIYSKNPNLRIHELKEDLGKLWFS